MNRILIFFVFVLSAYLLWGSVSSDQAAQAGLQHYLNSIPQKQLSDFGFNNAAELKQVKIEQGFQLLSLSEDKITQWKSNEPDNSLFHSDSLHLYPLSVNGKYKCMLAVDFTNGDWKAVSIGYRDLSIKMEQIRKTWIDKDIRIVRVYPLKRYYFTIADAVQPNCTQIHFDKANQTESYISLTPLNEAMRYMQTELIRSGQGGNHEN